MFDNLICLDIPHTLDNFLSISLNVCFIVMAGESHQHYSVISVMLEATEMEISVPT